MLDKQKISSEILDMHFQHDLPDGIYRIRQEHTEQLAVMFAETFLELNKIWSSFQLDKTLLKQFFIKEITHHIEAEQRTRQLYNNPDIILNQFVTHKKRIVGAALHIQIDQYRKSLLQSADSEIQLFKQLEREGKQLIKVVDINSYESGKYVYASFAAHYKIPEIKPVQKLHEAAIIYDQMRSLGFKGMIFRSSNEKIVQLHLSLGGKLLKKTPFIRDQKQFELFFMQEQFDNPKMLEFVQIAKKANIFGQKKQ